MHAFFHVSVNMLLFVFLLCFLTISYTREFKQITTNGATTAAVTEKVWGDYVSVVC